MLWYYARNDQRFGPVDESELRRLAAASQIGPNDLVWRQDFPDWRKAAEVPGLLPPASPAAPRTPTPPPPPAAAYAPPPASLYTPAPPAPLAQPTQYADFGSRFAAALIDGVILFLFNTVINLAAMAMARAVSSPGLQLAGSLMTIPVDWLYFAFSESSERMATPGKKVLGLVVTNLQGQRVSFGQATGRYFGKIISGLVLLIGYFAMLWSPKNQTWHDQMAGCLVLKTR